MDPSNNLNSAPTPIPASPTLSISSAHSTNTNTDLQPASRPTIGPRKHSANSEVIPTRRVEGSRPASDLLTRLDNARNMAPLPTSNTFMLPDAALRQPLSKDIDTESNRLSISSLYSLGSNAHVPKGSGPSSIAGSEPDSHRKFIDSLSLCYHGFLKLTYKIIKHPFQF
jgi:hypothetical protein